MLAKNASVVALALSLATVGCADDGAASGETDAADDGGTDTGTETTAQTESEGETDPDSDTDSQQSEFPVPTDEVDYGACEDTNLHQPECDGIECAAPEYQDEVALLLEVVEGAGLSQVFAVHRVDGFPDTDQLFINYTVHVGWFRANSNISLKFPLTQAELRDRFEQHVSSMEVPTEIAPLETVRAAVGECFDFVFDPCEHNWSDFDIHVQQEGDDDCDDVRVTVVDLETGEALWCRQEPVACK